MQLLVYLAVAAATTPVTGPGAEPTGLVSALACDEEDLVEAVEDLRAAGCITRLANGDEETLLITPSGATIVEQWLVSIAPLFSQWPPEHPSVDDATG